VKRFFCAFNYEYVHKVEMFMG